MTEGVAEGERISGWDGGLADSFPEFLVSKFLIWNSGTQEAEEEHESVEADPQVDLFVPAPNRPTDVFQTKPVGSFLSS
jgi:hypothetical protein